MNKPSYTITHLIQISLMTALICVLSPFTIPLPFSPVPLSLTQLPIFISLYILGWRNGTCSYLIYLLLGFVGLPVFSGFTGGFGKIAGPTGGYLVGLVIMALISGMFIEKSCGKTLPSVFGMILGNTLACLFGTVWLCFQLQIHFSEGLLLGVVPYLPGDILKITAAAMVGPHLKKIVSHI